MRYVIIAQTGSTKLLVVDTEQHTVEELDGSSSALTAIRNLRAEGGAIYRGVDVAIASAQRDDGSARWFLHDS